jgi:heterodisulfide reductase subunit A-like polyferredoxin
MKKDKYIPPFKDIPKARQKPISLSLEERKGNFLEVEKGFTEEMARAEAQRCLSCRKCIGCGLCLAECDVKAIEYNQAEELIKLKVGNIVLAPGVDKIDPRRQKELGYSQYHNVITSIEFERILHSDGVYGGFILRPYDGEIPKSIAFILCIGCRDEYLGANYCGSICCMTAIKEAMIAQEKIAGLKVKIFYRDIRPWGIEGEEYYLKARKQRKVEFLRAEVKQIAECPESKNLVLTYLEAGEERREEFELIVLSIAPAAPTDARTLAKKVGIKVNSYNFAQTDPLSPLEASKNGIYIAGSFTTPMDLQGSLLHARAVSSKIFANVPRQSRHTKGQCLVIGGGVSGMRAALDLAQQGISTYLLEKEEKLGGALNQIHYLLGGSEPQKYLATLSESIQTHPNIKLLLHSRIITVEGEAGQFRTTITHNGNQENISHAAIILATGVRERVPTEYHYGNDPRVLTQRELEQRLAENQFGGKEIIMIQCVGSRNAERPYCSRVCCSLALKNALKILERDKEAQVYILFDDMRVYGFAEEYLTAAIDQGVKFIPWLERPVIVSDKDLEIKVVNELTRQEVRLLPDYLVLSSAGLPQEANDELARILKIKTNPHGFITEEDSLENPLVTTQEGIFVCGWARGPCTIPEAIVQGSSTAYQVMQWLIKKKEKEE